jgi:hypothetical protein
VEREVGFKTLCVGQHVQLRSDKQTRGFQRPQLPLMMLDRQANVYKKLQFTIYKDDETGFPQSLLDKVIDSTHDDDVDTDDEILE